MARTEITSTPETGGNPDWLFSRAVESVKDFTRVWVAALGITASASMALAEERQEIQYADASPVILAVASWETTTDALPIELEWVANIDFSKPEIRAFVELRSWENFVYFAPYLQEFSELSPVDQLALVQADAGIGWSLDDDGNVTEAMSQEATLLLANLRVSPELEEAIIAEAIDNGARESWFWADIPAYRQALSELRQAWDTWAWTLERMSELAPNTAWVLPVLIRSQALIAESERLLVALEEWKLEAEELRVALEEWKLEAEELRVALEEWRIRIEQIQEVLTWFDEIERLLWIRG